MKTNPLRISPLALPISQSRYDMDEDAVKKLERKKGIVKIINPDGEEILIDFKKT
jgi:hypothetical protein